MPKRPPRIEDFLSQNHDSPNLFSTDFEAIDLETKPMEIDQLGTYDVSFDELMKFSFPDDELPESISQVGQVEYVGDGVCKLSGIEEAKIEDIISIQTAEGIEQALVLGVQE